IDDKGNIIKQFAIANRVKLNPKPKLYPDHIYTSKIINTKEIITTSQ
ncbi:11456_t:CDS:1, partial [Scutellospora calospora]